MTGTKTNTRIMETPQSISVIGADQIRDQKPASVAEALRYTPGVAAQFFGADTRNDWFQIRGFNAQDVGLLMDGLPLPAAFGFATWKLPINGLERIDILRGPSAVLYGGGSPGGFVNLISKTPPNQPLNYVETGVNSFGNAYFTFDFGGPVAIKSSQSDDLFYKAKQSNDLYYRMTGTVKNGGTQTDFTNDNSYSFSPSVRYRPDLDTSLTIIALAQKDQTRGQGFLPYVGTVTNAPFGKIGTSLFASDPRDDYFKRETEMLGYQFEKSINESVTFRQNARISHDEVEFQTLLGNGYVNGNPSTAMLSRFNDFARDNATQGNIDNQLEYRFNTGPVQHTALFGVDYKHYYLADLQAFDFGTPALNLVNPVYGVFQGFPGTVFQNQNFTQQQTGVYMQDQIKLGRLTVVASGRNDWVNLNDNNLIGASLSRDDSKSTGRIGVIYNTPIGLAPYASYATSFNPLVGTNFQTGQLFLPETGQQGEVGVKFEPAGFNGHFTAALFDLKRQNVLTANPANITQAFQTGEVTSRGVELEAVGNVTPELKLVASFTDFRIFDSKDVVPALVGTVPTNTPSEMASAWADYTIQNGRLAGFGFGGGVRYVGISYADQANTLVVPSFVLGDLALHYQVANWRFALNITNIADHIYVGGCSSATACFYGDRRRETASVSYKW
ncbi:TonB-dependent siderophore receptor [Bradyrhizobium sp. dw_411]|uniref:TonB-dependent siderophore receptor n=1 Tax=Bradyrhizobium sp. dw_411 TaxID=2720082 RepID=UPI00201BB129|nr:TonB-dependent siderophore receptor [Bradyrhizobium sp. dw_411]